MKFITFEGMDGSGKTTGVQYVAERLNEIGLKCIVTREPGGSEMAERIRDLVLDAPDDAICDKAELLLMYASRMQHLRDTVRPALAAGIIVLCDRFIDSSMAYQGYGKGLKSYVHGLNSLLLRGFRIDHTLYFRAPYETLKARCDKRGKLNRFDTARQEQNDLVREGYEDSCVWNSDRFIVIDAAKSLEGVREELDAFIASDLVPDILKGRSYKQR